MTNEIKQQFARRITQANKTELVVILYEMLIQYFKDAQFAAESENEQQFNSEIRRIRQCIDELIASLDLKYPLAVNLFQIYQYMKRELILVKIENTSILNNLKDITEELLMAYREISKQDDSLPVMDRAESVYAGMTYGKTSIVENADQGRQKRGYLV